MQHPDHSNSRQESLKEESYHPHYSTPKPPKNTTLTTYADDMNPAASHHNYLKAHETLQPYLEEIYSWTKENDLILNPDKSIATLFTPDPAEYNKTLNLRINNTLIPTVKNP